MANRGRGANPSDVTGRQRAEAQKAHAAEQQEAAQRMSMITATKDREEANTITDLTGSGPVDLRLDELSADDRAAVEYAEDDFGDDEIIENARVEGPVPMEQTTEVSEDPSEGTLTEIVHSRPVRARNTTRIIRVNTDLESVTVGYGNTYTFLEGRRYKVPAEVADHLEGLGYVWH